VGLVSQSFIFYLPPRPLAVTRTCRMALEGEKLKKFNAQFQRSTASPLQEVTAPRVVLDGATVLDKYLSGEPATSMSGAEFYAVVGHLKLQEGQKGDALEAELMKVTRQADKKTRLLEWCTQNIGQREPPARSPAPVAPQERMPAAGTPSRSAAEAKPELLSISRLDLSGALAERDVGGQQSARQRPATARPQLGGDAMAGLLGGGPAAPAPPLTARPATASDAGGAPLADMSAVVQQYAEGKDHLKMSGSEYYSLVAWLKARGHGGKGERGPSIAARRAFARTQS
jgi:hypothetical protein